MPVITQFPVDIKLPYQCPLHPARDVHGKAELAKLNYRVNLWTCSQCGKSFSEERDLETHIHHRHPGLSDHGDFSVCLADWCDLLRCDPLMERVVRRPWPVRQPREEKSSLHQVVRAPSRELVSLLENTDSGLTVPRNIESCSISGNCVDLDPTIGNIGARRARRLALTDESQNNSCRDCYKR